MRTGRSRSRATAVIAAGVVAACAAVAADLVGLLPGLEQESISQRFERRAASPAPNLLVVAVDDKTFSDMHLQWPFARRFHARAIDQLRRYGARAIVYDVQFTEQTTARDDNALITAIDRAHDVILATAETDEHGRTNVLGGAALLTSIGARVGASNLPEGPGGVVQRFAPAHAGLPTLATVAAAAVHRTPPKSSFEDGGAWIDFHGPAGTIDTVSFSDLVAGRVAPAQVRGRIVVVGATSPTLQDVNPTPTGERLMSGPEIEANAIDSAIRGLPLRGTATWIALLITLGLGLMPALIGLRLRALVAALAAPVIAVAFLLVSQYAFEHGRILPVAVPLFALSLGTMSATVGGYVIEHWRRGRDAQRSEKLELAVSDRTSELRDTQLEIIHRLAAATESRDQATGLHLERIGRLCERLGLAMGMTPPDAETLRNASLLHDVGKIGVPDAILLQPGALSAADRELMQRHTAIGARLLGGSRSPVMRVAEEIARTHHERWDGAGYPQRLTGEAIPLAGRICAVCDVFDALISERPYKQAWPLERVLAELRHERGLHFDPAVTDIFLAIVDDLDPALLSPTTAARPLPGASQRPLDIGDFRGP